VYCLQNLKKPKIVPRNAMPEYPTPLFFGINDKETGY
jgi:hypothetical protein